MSLNWRRSPIPYLVAAAALSYGLINGVWAIQSLSPPPRRPDVRRSVPNGTITAVQDRVYMRTGEGSLRLK